MTLENHINSNIIITLNASFIIGYAIITLTVVQIEAHSHKVPHNLSTLACTKAVFSWSMEDWSVFIFSCKLSIACACSPLVLLQSFISLHSTH